MELFTSSAVNPSSVTALPAEVVAVFVDSARVGVLTIFDFDVFAAAFTGGTGGSGSRGGGSRGGGFGWLSRRFIIAGFFGGSRGVGCGRTVFDTAFTIVPSVASFAGFIIDNFVNREWLKEVKLGKAGGKGDKQAINRTVLESERDCGGTQNGNN
ncbi:MAG: hypothetical protein UX59_C0018G0003 [Microgenomates group bacterium GW2011_GWA1_46_7]|nr:MAG: hypothetical protein UX59_C0018G0003 [Microgenomates group bacterium GW2011_GWA1_46_7]